MGVEGFSSESALLYHQHLPTAIVDSVVYAETDQPVVANHPLLPRHFKTHKLDVGGVDTVTGRQLLLANDDVRISYAAADRPSPLYRNATGDECVYIEAGNAVVETVFGALSVGPGDYVMLPTSTTHRWVPTGGDPLRTLVIEAGSHIGPPKRYVSARGQFLEHSPYSERDLRGPVEPFRAQGEDVQVLVRHRAGMTSSRTHSIPSTSWAGMAAFTRTCSTSATSSRSPGDCTSRRQFIKPSRAAAS